MLNNVTPPRRNSTATPEDYEALRKVAKAAQVDFNRAQGALNEIESQLKADFACQNIGEAKGLLAKLESEEANAKSEFEAEYSKYKEEWDAIRAKS